jgi:hypothetical protein
MSHTKKPAATKLVIVVAHMDALDSITDRVLSYHPKPKRKKTKKRKAAKKEGWCKIVEIK